MKSLNSIHKIVTIFLFVGLVGLVACDGPISSDIDNIEDSQQEEVTSFTEDFGPKAIDGQYIVVFKDDVQGTEVSNTANKMAAKSRARVKNVYTRALKGFVINLPEETLEQDLEALRNDPRVLFIEQDYEVRGSESQPNATWGLDRSDQRSLPFDGVYNYSSTADNVTAYILDSGINYSHVDFGGRASFGFDVYGEEGNDCNGHGTHVAGTVGGSQWGIAKNVDLVSVRVLNCNNSGTVSGVLEGIDWITQNANGPSVVNMSLVTSATINSLDTAIENAVSSGIPFVIAAGNLDSDACSYSPSRATKGIIVGASDNTDNRAYFSNYGSCVDLFAPGTDITSAFIGSNSATKVKNGTSMATPHVAGVVALYLQSNPDASPSEVESFIISNATQNIVTNSNSNNNHLLYSIFNDSEDGGNENSVPVADFSFSGDYLNVQFTDGSTDSDGTISSRSWNFGDGSSSSSTNPSHAYDGGGTYTVSLTVTDDNGDSDTVSKTVTVEEQQAQNNPPSADFDFSVDDLDVEFNDESSDSDGSISSRSWNFGDGSSSSSTNPSHTYSQEGTYTVTLTVTDNDGDSDSVSKTVTVTEPAGSTISLDVDSYKRRGRWAARIYWEGASSSKVDIYRNGSRITRTSNDGYYDDRTNYNGGGSLTYQVCEAYTSTCSDEVTVYY